jgi:hypothetical protein
MPAPEALAFWSYPLLLYYFSLCFLALLNIVSEEWLPLFGKLYIAIYFPCWGGYNNGNKKECKDAVKMVFAISVWVSL